MCFVSFPDMSIQVAEVRLGYSLENHIMTEFHFKLNLIRKWGKMSHFVTIFLESVLSHIRAWNTL